MLREARLSDREGVVGLLGRHGMSVAERSPEAWQAMWAENPAIADRPLPIGWVLETPSSAVVGYLGNVAQRYSYGGRSLLAAATRAFAVDAEYRSHSMQLVAAFFSQPGVDLLLNTTANAPAASIFQLGRASRVPQPDCDKALFAIVEPFGFSRASLKRYRWPDWMAAASSVFMTPTLKVEGFIRSRRPPRSNPAWPTTVHAPSELTDEFDDFWTRMRAQRPACMLADRSLPSLRWHFGRAGVAGRQPVVICTRTSGKLAGYVIVTREDVEETGLKRSRIADLLADGDRDEIIDALAAAAHHHAAAEGCHVLELTGFPALVRDRLIAQQALSRQLPSWPYWYKATEPDLAESLRNASAWYMTPFDGDASL